MGYLSSRLGLSVVFCCTRGIGGCWFCCDGIVCFKWNLRCVVEFSCNLFCFLIFDCRRRLCGFFGVASWVFFGIRLFFVRVFSIVWFFSICRFTNGGVGDKRLKGRRKERVGLFCFVRGRFLRVCSIYFCILFERFCFIRVF